MILVDTALAKREAEGNPIRVAVVGAGFQGAAIVPIEMAGKRYPLSPM